MSDSVKLLLIGGEPRNVVSDDTSLMDVKTYFQEQYSEQQERQMRYSLREIPRHANL